MASCWTTVCVATMLVLGSAAGAWAKQAIPEKQEVALPNPLLVVPFAEGSTRISSSSADALDAVVEWMRENPLRLVIVEGHADSTGGTAANLRLSQQRSDSVRDELVRRGADPIQIVSAAYGERGPNGAGPGGRRVVVRGTVQTYEDLLRSQRPQRK